MKAVWMIVLAGPVLIGAAAPGDIAGAAECRLTQISAEYAYRTLNELSREGDAEDEEEGLTITLDPAGSKVLGGDASKLTLYKDPTVQRYEAVVSGNYAKAKAALFTAHGLSKCDTETGPAGGQTCEMKLPAKGEWQRTMRVFDAAGKLETTCVYSRG